MRYIIGLFAVIPYVLGIVIRSIVVGFWVGVDRVDWEANK